MPKNNDFEPKTTILFTKSIVFCINLWYNLYVIKIRKRSCCRGELHKRTVGRKKDRLDGKVF